MHYTTRKFWKCYDDLPENVRDTANQCYSLLKADPSHPSLHFKKIGNKYWSVRAGLDYRAAETHVIGSAHPTFLNSLIPKSR
jgi:hypothetical protein